jgi:hypothetical protein
MKNGALVAECLCWQPTNTNFSILPASNAGASCVIDQITPGAVTSTGGDAMCDAMKNGALVSTYGPTGWKPNLVVAECAPKTQWAWCWGAPCSISEGDIICDCPIIITDNNATQYLSLSQQECDMEDDPCSFIHNSSPGGGKSPQPFLTKCEK